MAKQGLNFKLGTKVTAAEKTGNGVKVSVEDVKDPSKKEEVRILFCIKFYSARI